MEGTRSALAALWSDVLKCGDITDDTDFFECGGTSLEAVHLAALVQETFGAPLDAIEIVEHRTFARIHRLVDDRAATST